jgi:hypothetical protein
VDNRTSKRRQTTQHARQWHTELMTDYDVDSGQQEQPDAARLALPQLQQSGAVQHVPDICGFADIAVMKASDAGLIGEGPLLATLAVAARITCSSRELICCPRCSVPL